MISAVLEEIAASWRWMEERCKSRDENGAVAELATGAFTTGGAAAEERTVWAWIESDWSWRSMDSRCAAAAASWRDWAGARRTNAAASASRFTRVASADFGEFPIFLWAAKG